MKTYDMNAGRNRRKRENTDTTENQKKLREQLKQRNSAIDTAAPEPAPQQEPAAHAVQYTSPQEQPSAEAATAPTGLAADKPCFITVAIPESIKRIADTKVRYDSKELPQYNQTMKHIGRRWFLRGMLAEGLITQEQFDEASALHSEYGWEREKVAAKRRKG